MKINGKEVIINRTNAVVSEIDEVYYNLCKKILGEGQKSSNRTGIDTYSIVNYSFILDLQKGFPILETKKVVAKNFSSEIQWIHQAQSNRVDWLHERENHVWDLWVVDNDGIYRIYEQGNNTINDPERMVPLKRQVRNFTTGVIEKIPVYDEYHYPIMIKSKDLIDGKDNPRTIKEAIWFGKEYAGTIGEAYGFINKEYHMSQRVEWTLKNNPMDRRININLWQEAHLEKAVLPSCVWSCEFNVSPDGKLHLFVHQRSADVPAGLPFNVPQYALILSMYAKASGYEVGTLAWSIANAHIYENQIDMIKKQMKRYEYMQEYSNIIQISTDEELELLYNKIKEKYTNVNIAARILINKYFDDLKMSEKIKELKKYGNNVADEFEEAYERKICFEHMITRETPELELANHDSIFEYSIDYAKKDDSYLKENPIGNKELVLKKYHSTPFIKMPIAQ